MLAQRSVPNQRVEYVDLVAARTAIQPGQSGGVAFPAAGFQSCRRLSPYPRLARGCSFGPEAGALGYRIRILASSPLGFGVYSRIGFREYFRWRVYEGA